MCREKKKEFVYFRIESKSEKLALMENLMIFTFKLAYKTSKEGRAK